MIKHAILAARYAEQRGMVMLEMDNYYSSTYGCAIEDAPLRCPTLKNVFLVGTSNGMSGEMMITCGTQAKLLGCRHKFQVQNRRLWQKINGLPPLLPQQDSPLYSEASWRGAGGEVKINELSCFLQQDATLRVEDDK
jgi:hypothetical protein